MNAPALVIAIPVLLGALCGASIPVPHSAQNVALGTAWLSAAVAFRRGHPGGFLIAASAGFLVAGAALAADASRAAENPTLLTWYSQHAPDAPSHLAGVLRADAMAGASAISLTLDVSQVDGRPVNGGVRLSVAGLLAPASVLAWRAGRSLSVDALLREPLDYRDPGVPGDRQRLARQGINLLGSVKSAALVDVVAGGSFMSEAAAALRGHVRTATASSVGRWSAASAGVVTAILIGDRSGLDAEDERRLQEAGTYHVIAISGGNIALLTALLVACGRAARLPPRTTAAGSIALLAFYGYASGLAPSVLRATVAGMIYLAGRALDHRGAALNAVGVAAAFAAIVAPLTVLDPGFVLSFGATFAIIVAAHRIGVGPVVRRRDRTAGRLRSWIAAASNAARLLGAATLCAEIALAPVGARLFGRVSFAGLFLNFAAIPLMSIIQVAGLATVALAAVSTSLAAAAGWIAHASTIALLRSARVVDAAPWLVLDLPPPSWPVIAAWYAGWGGLLFAVGRRRRIASVALAIVASILMLASPPWARATRVPSPPPGWTRIVFLDVGQGDAALLQPPDGAATLVDAGGVPGATFDLGRRVTLPAVWAFGVTHLAALVLTHGDPDHIGGAPPVIRALAPREIWDGVPVPPHESLQRLREAARRAAVPWIQRRAGESMTAGGARIRVLNPPEPDWERRRVRNDDSVVLEVRVGNVTFVLPGDITQAVEPAVLALLEPAPIVIAKAPHHGSAGSSSQAFVDALHAAAVVFSAGRRNPFGHPSPAVVERYRNAGAAVFSTADDGAVGIDTDGQQVVIWTWTGRRVVLSGATRHQENH